MKKILLLSVGIFISLHGFDQPVKHKKKELKFLDTIKKVKVVFVYDSLTFDGDNKSEAAYL